MKGAHFMFGAAMLLSTACAPVPNKVTMADRDPLRRAIVEDVVEGMSEVFEASETTLVPARAMSGAFDTALMAALRARGFIVQGPTGRGDAFDCSVERVEGSMYRVTASVGKTVLSRLWVLDGADAYSGGAWARRE